MSAKHFQPTFEPVSDNIPDETSEDEEPDRIDSIITPQENIVTPYTLNSNTDDICVACGVPLSEGDGMVCQECLKNRGPKRSVNNIHIEDSYTIWSTSKMFDLITEKCRETYSMYEADRILNRTYCGMYFEWWLHNIGYWFTFPLTKIKKSKHYVKDLNM